MDKVQQVHKRTVTDNDRRTVIHWFVTKLSGILICNDRDVKRLKNADQDELYLL